MAAPTPVRALVHSSTLVTAGVYALIRYCHLEPLFLFYVGSCTILMAGVCANAEIDIKKVVALSTLSQLGIIMVAISANEKRYCFFHLLSHALFKALLFISVGVSIHSLYGTQDFRSFNQRIDGILFHSYCISCFSLIGLVFTSGFYSKDIILELLHTRSSIVVVFLMGIILTASYSSKIIKSFIDGHTDGYLCQKGGEGVYIKIPLFFLSAMRVVFGSHYEDYTGLIINVTREKIIPVLLIAVGRMGFTPSSHKLYGLQPLRQQLAKYKFRDALRIEKGFSFLGDIIVSPILEFFRAALVLAVLGLLFL